MKTLKGHALRPIRDIRNQACFRFNFTNTIWKKSLGGLTRSARKTDRKCLLLHFCKTKIGLQCYAALTSEEQKRLFRLPRQLLQMCFTRLKLDFWSVQCAHFMGVNFQMLTLLLEAWFASLEHDTSSSSSSSLANKSWQIRKLFYWTENAIQMPIVNGGFSSVTAAEELLHK